LDDLYAFFSGASSSGVFVRACDQRQIDSESASNYTPTAPGHIALLLAYYSIGKMETSFGSIASRRWRERAHNAMSSRISVL
jgi:hypothetical protein